MGCPKCSAVTRYVVNDERTEILGTACTKCAWSTVLQPELPPTEPYLRQYPISFALLLGQYGHEELIGIATFLLQRSRLLDTRGAEGPPSEAESNFLALTRGTIERLKQQDKARVVALVLELLCTRVEVKDDPHLIRAIEAGLPPLDLSADALPQGAGAKFEAIVGDGVADEVTLRHGVDDVYLVQVFDVATGAQLKPMTVHPSPGVLTVRHAVLDVQRGAIVGRGPIPKGGWKVIVHGGASLPEPGPLYVDGVQLVRGASVRVPIGDTHGEKLDAESRPWSTRRGTW